MYNEYFGFRDSPFSIAPNPQFLYMSERHREALAHLLYGIKSDGGFILLTGEVGTGKTTVCRCLLEQLPGDVEIAFVLNPKLTAEELLASACDDLGIEYPAGASIKGLVDRLNAHLLAAHQDGRRCVLIIDEAQNLSIDVLEQLRLLTNLETNQRKLLQIILLGQPELLHILARNELRQLSQRVTARFHLEALNREEVESYIEHRLEIAGGRGKLFPPDAVRRVGDLSGGIPRLINLICDRALLGTYAQNRLQVDRQTIDNAAREIFGSREKPPTNRRAAIMIACLVVLAALATYMALVGKPAQAPVMATPTSPEIKQESLAAAGSMTGETAAADSPGAGFSGPEPGNSTLAAVPDGSAADLPEVMSAPLAPRPLNRLIEVEGSASRAAAMRLLFGAWDVPSANGQCDDGEGYNLRCMTLLGSLRDLAHLNRPALVELKIANLSHFLVVTGTENSALTVVSENGTFRLGFPDVLEAWDGRFTILWRPPAGFRLLQAGDESPLVGLLRTQLQLVDQAEPALSATNLFDTALAERLKRFQLSRELRPDGIAGEQTWIHLNTAAGKPVPRLIDPTGDES
ncbi:MAG: AAA family ATPase [Pseudomonadota bacterium]